MNLANDVTQKERIYFRYRNAKSEYMKLKQHNIGGAKKKDKFECKDCVESHKSSGGNYEWLNVLGYGNVLRIEFEEPIDSGNWRVYTDKWWKVHCGVIDHTPENLANAHIKAFVNKKTRFARKRFTFENGNVVEPTEQFYELEQEYFKKRHMCEKAK